VSTITGEVQTYNKKIFSKHYIKIKNIGVLLTTISISLIAYITGGSISAYYAGLILVIIGACQMFLYTLKEALIECLLIMLCYSIIIILLPNNTPFNLQIFF
jgi:hypothetical protein